MATYTKPLKSIEVKTGGGSTINAADTEDAPIASNALAEFEAHMTMHIKGEEGETLVPFDAVDTIEVTVSSAEVERPDAYCAE